MKQQGGGRRAAALAAVQAKTWVRDEVRKVIEKVAFQSVYVGMGKAYSHVPWGIPWGILREYGAIATRHLLLYNQSESHVQILGTKSNTVGVGL